MVSPVKERCYNIRPTCLASAGGFVPGSYHTKMRSSDGLHGILCFVLAAGLRWCTDRQSPRKLENFVSAKILLPLLKKNLLAF